MPSTLGDSAVASDTLSIEHSLTVHVQASMTLHEFIDWLSSRSSDR
jgi:hypothetical protein